MRAATLVMALLSATPVLAAEPHLPVGDPVYRRLERLAALGLIDEGLLGTRPLTREALALIAREAGSKAPGVSDSWIVSDIRAIEDRLSSLGMLSEAVLDTWFAAREGPLVPMGLERHGDRLERGGNARLGAEFGGVHGGWVAWGYHPEIRSPVGPTDGLDLAARSAYLALVGGGLALTVGRESLWWGPGFRGSLLLTDNAPPFDMVRVETVRPWRLTWIGPASAHLVVTRLEADRAAIPSPYLAGVRLAFRPHPLLEFGLARTAMFGGEGRPVTGRVLWDVVRARGENTDGGPGNQLAAADVVIRCPWRIQPISVYAEVGGEDEANGWPSHPAVVAGVYLPGVLGSPRWEFRGEWADNALAHVPQIWYRHGTYQSGYTYKGFVIGHPMGTDARMVSVELDRRMTPEWTASVFYDGFQGGVFGPGETSGRDAGAGVSYEHGGLSGQLEYRYTRLERPGEPWREDGHVVTVSARSAW